jgi:transposase
MHPKRHIVKSKEENKRKDKSTENVVSNIPPVSNETDGAFKKGKTAIDVFIGVDVGKFFLDVYCFSNGKRYLKVENNKKSILCLIKKLLNEERVNPNKTLVTIDLTGNYETLCRDLFYDNSFTNIYLADGKKIKYFKKSKKNNGAKTDKLDSYYLALYGKENLNNLNLYERGDNGKALEELQKIELRINDLKDFLVKEKNRLQSPNIPKLVEKDIKETVKFLEKKIAKLENEANNIINSDGELKTKYGILSKQYGVGDITAKTLVSFLPELGQLNKNKISSLGGTAPIARDSGTIKGYRSSKGTGRQIIRKALFMAVLSSVRKDNSYLNIFYKSLVQRGKKKMVAMVACMRKLVIYLNSLIRNEYYLKEDKLT